MADAKVYHVQTTEDVEYKKCITCSSFLVLNTDNYYSRKKDGVIRWESECKKCRIERVQKNRKNNPEKYKLEIKRNSELISEKRKRNKEYSNSLEKAKKRMRKIRGNVVFREREKHLQRQWYINNKERFREWRKRYAETERGREVIRNNIKRRQAAKNKLLSTLSIDQWEECKAYFDHSCAYCGSDAETLHQEHVVPVVKGGHYTKQNIIPACQSCNFGKHASDMEVWYKRQEFFSVERLKRIHNWTGYDSEKHQQQIELF